MPIEEMTCDTCAEADMPQKYSWRKTEFVGTLRCNACSRIKDFRQIDAKYRGENRWLKSYKSKTGKLTYRCKSDGKVAFVNLEEAQEKAFTLNLRVYFDPKCRFNHMTSKPIRR